MKKAFFLAFLILAITIAQTGNAYAYEAIVDPYQVFSYETMLEDIERIQAVYPSIVETHIIGRTELGRIIWAVKLGKGDVNVFINGSHHAREWISTNITMKMLDRYAQAYNAEETLGGYPAQEILNQVSIWFVPMVNPDGVTLQQQGIETFPEEIHSSLVAMNLGSTCFKSWKANARGVDNNRQYPANWDMIEYVPGRTLDTIRHRSPDTPSFAHYKGEAPFTERENIALRDFTYIIDPEIAVSYHSSGRVIFFPDNSPKQYIAQGLADLTGYELRPLEEPAGGYTDWFVQEFNRPAYTPELSPRVGPTNPPLSFIPEEWERNKLVGLYIAVEGLMLWEERQSKKVLASVEEEKLQVTKEKTNYWPLEGAGLYYKDHISRLYFSGDHLMVPIRIIEDLGFQVSYCGVRMHVLISNHSSSYTADLVSQTLITDRASYNIESRIPGVTSVPVDFIVEAVSTNPSP